MKSLVFKKDVESDHGNFAAGDIGKNIPDEWADAMVEAGHAEITSGEPGGDHALKMREMDGKVTINAPGKAAGSERPFNATVRAAQQPETTAAPVTPATPPHTPPANLPGHTFVGTGSIK